MAYVDRGHEYTHKRVGPGTYGKFVCDPDEMHGSGVGQDDWVWVLSDGTVKEVNCPECLKLNPNNKPKRGRPKGSKDKAPRKRVNKSRAGLCKNCGKGWSSHYGINCDPDKSPTTTTWEPEEPEGMPEQETPHDHAPEDPDWPDVYVKLSPELAMVLSCLIAKVGGISEGRALLEKFQELLIQEGYNWDARPPGMDWEHNNYNQFTSGGVSFKPKIPERSKWHKSSKPV